MVKQIGSGVTWWIWMPYLPLTVTLRRLFTDAKAEFCKMGTLTSQTTEGKNLKRYCMKTPTIKGLTHTNVLNKRLRVIMVIKDQKGFCSSHVGPVRLATT